MGLEREACLLQNVCHHLGVCSPLTSGETLLVDICLHGVSLQMVGRESRPAQSM